MPCLSCEERAQLFRSALASAKAGDLSVSRDQMKTMFETVMRDLRNVATKALQPSSPPSRKP